MADVEKYLDLITAFHRGKPKFSAMVEAVAKCSVDAQNVYAQMVDAYDLDQAVGVQLDAVGEWVGISRNVRTHLEDVLDNGDLAALQAQLQSALLAASPGRLLGVQVFTSSGTYTPGTYNGVKARSARVRAIGAGGGGGGAASTTSTTTAVGIGGGYGAYGECFIPTLAASYPITIGAGGAGGTSAGGNGGSGGATSIGGIMVCPGGQGGPGGLQALPPYIYGTTAVQPSVTGTGQIIVAGKTGQGTYGVALSAGSFVGGFGGDTIFGGGGHGASQPGQGFGSGGAGAASGGGTPGLGGGAGANGYLIVEEYA